jgi:2-polyprenyl-3-methyl-5-hydroxy-6-metoxy-1,4-benzoquinol methylase
MTAEETRCNQCGNAATLAFVAKDLNRRLTDEQFPYYRCSNCGLVFLHPVPANLGRYYPSNYHDIPRSLDELLQRRRGESYKLEALARVSGKRLLEIGPSFGAFAALARQAGFDVQTIEMDEQCCRFIREVVGVPAEHTGDVAAALQRTGRYDVIAMWHSLEHLPNPWDVLDELPRHLEPGGALLFATPNPESLQFRFFGRRWVHLDAPRHVNLIPHGVLEARLARAGMRRAYFTTEDSGAQECNLLGWIASSRTKLPRWERSRLASAAWKLAIPPSRLLERGRYGAAYTMGFTKA